MADKNAKSDQRKTEGLIRDLIDLVPPKRELPTLSREEPKGGIPQRRGSAERNLQPGTGSGEGGIVGPLTEGATGAPGAPVLDRTYYPPAQVVSSDGMFVWEFQSIDTLQLRDGTGNPLQLILADPYA